MIDPQDAPSPSPQVVRTRVPPAWFIGLVSVTVLAGLVSGGLVALVVDSGGSGSSDAIVKTTTATLPSVVTIINEIAPQPGFESGAVAGGAGFVVDERGLILTNAHIVLNPGELTVILSDGEQRPATVVAHDAPFSDLAVIQVAPGGLREMPIGDSAELVPGQALIAIGSPDFDYANTVTTGIVSGLQRRKLIGGVFLEDLIQTDAAINSGSSGGPLVTLKGEAVGIITFRDVGADEDIESISFAISSRSFAPFVQSIVESGSFPRPYFGIEHVDLNPDEAASLGLNPAQRGAYVQRAIAGSPASGAGLRTGDIILRIGNTELNPNMTFISALSRVAANSRVSVQVLRAGQTNEIQLDLPSR